MIRKVTPMRTNWVITTLAGKVALLGVWTVREARHGSSCDPVPFFLDCDTLLFVGRSPHESVN